MHTSGTGSSPLRHGGDDEAWVRRTEEVHLNSEMGEAAEELPMEVDMTEVDMIEDQTFDQEKLKEQYMTLLCGLSLHSSVRNS